MVVDDSGFMRMALRRIIEADGDLRVVGEASNGEQAVELAARLHPDIVTMDLEMPGLDGIAATRRLSGLPNPPAIVMVSHHTRDGSDGAVAAMAAGAADVLWKGSAIGALDLAGIDRALRGRLRHWAGQRQNLPRRAPEVVPQRPGRPVPDTPIGPGCDVVVLAASTGGPDALAALLEAAGPLPVPVVVAQHMPADLGPDFVRHLGRRGGVPAVLAVHGAVPRPGETTVIPGATDGHLARGGAGAPPNALVLRLAQGPGVVHPSADMLFRSAALVARRAIGAVLTGMGRDGAEGTAAMRERGMAVLAQSPESCVVAGMPRAVIEAGLAVGVGNPAALGARLRALAVPLAPAARTGFGREPA
nr:chemotaxis protein CheB [Pararoseomonas indoligenes]